MQVAVVLSEKVDTTLSKGVLRIVGTVVGGTLGEHMIRLTLLWRGTVGNVMVLQSLQRLFC